MSVMTERSVLGHLALTVFLIQGVLTIGLRAQEEGCAGGDRVRRVDFWGRPATTFSREPATTLEQLKASFETLRGDYEAVLRQAGWEGDPADLFAAVRNAREGTGAATARSAPRGTEFEWMAYRQRGKPACVKDIIWIGRDPFPAWQIVVESKGVEYTFLVPQACLNLGLEKGRRREVPPPSCSLTTSFDPEIDTITVTGSSDVADFRIVGAEGPGASLQQLRSAGSGRWTLRPSADGTFRFSARATANYGKQTDCSTTVDVVRKKPVCRLQATTDPDTYVIALSTAGSVGKVELVGVTLHDGSSGDLSAVRPSGSERWTYDAAPSLPKRPGDYTYGFNAVARLHDHEETCSASTVITKTPSEAHWILRGFGANLDASDEFRTEGVRPSGLAERTQLDIGSGSGLGLAAEYLFNRRVGIEGGILFADLDSNFILDVGEDWGMDSDDTEFTLLTLGVNFHLTPNHRVDFFIGPFFALVQYDDVQFTALAEQFNRDFDDDTTLGLNVGLDVPFDWESPWAFTAGFKYLETSAEGDNDNPDLDVDPLIFTAGIAYRFK